MTLYSLLFQAQWNREIALRVGIFLLEAIPLIKTDPHPAHGLNFYQKHSSGRTTMGVAIKVPDMVT
jgi:hypothetical protein